MAAQAATVYRSDISYGSTPMRRGHWSDRLAAIDKDIEALTDAGADRAQPERVDPKTRGERLKPTGRPARPSGVLHTAAAASNRERRWPCRLDGAGGAELRWLDSSALSPRGPGGTVEAGGDAGRWRRYLRRRFRRSTRESPYALSISLNLAREERRSVAVSGVQCDAFEPAVLRGDAAEHLRAVRARPDGRRRGAGLANKSAARFQRDACRVYRRGRDAVS